MTFGGTVRDQFEYGYDRNSNRTSRDNTLTSGLDELYAYDNLNRMTNMDRGTLSGGAIASPAKEQYWTLDPTGNWSGYVTKTSGTTDLNQSRAHNKVNEIGAVSETAGPAWVDPAHDQAGNMTTVPKPSDLTTGFTAVYDAWNRLVQLKDGTNTVAKYTHDARGRRIVKESYTAGLLIEVRHLYYSNDWQLLEERVGLAVTAERQHVWGIRYVDELVCRDRDVDGLPFNGLEERLYALQDANFDVTALTDTSGTVVERSSYTPYGTRSLHDASFGARASSSYSSDIGHQGLTHDGESGLVYNRNRIYHPALGRFAQRDPLGYVDGMSLYEYLRSGPVHYTDPSGLVLPAIPVVVGGIALAALEAAAAAAGLTLFACMMTPACRAAAVAGTQKIINDLLNVCRRAPVPVPVPIVRPAPPKPPPPPPCSLLVDPLGDFWCEGACPPPEFCDEDFEGICNCMIPFGF